MRGKWLLIGGSVVLLAIAAGALSRLRRTAAGEDAPPAKTAPAPALPAEVSLSGRVDPQHVVAAGAQVTGTVAELLADAGQEVYAGQVLARISNLGLEAAEASARSAAELAQARLEKAGAAILAARLEATRARADATRARTGLDRAQRTFERQRMLNREGATPRLAYEKSEREFESSQSESQSLEDLARVAENRVAELVRDQEDARRILDDKTRDLEDATAHVATAEVHSPVDGLVVERKGEVGREVGPQEQGEMFRIAVDLALLQVSVTPDAPVLQRLKPGDPALVVIPELGSEGLPAAVKEIQGSQAIVAFTSPNPAVKPGMNAQVRIRLSEIPADRVSSAPRPPS